MSRFAGNLACPLAWQVSCGSAVADELPSNCIAREYVDLYSNAHLPSR